MARRLTSHRPRRRAVLALATAITAASALALPASASPLGSAGRPALTGVIGTYKGILLALGDSLAAGYQPTDGTNPPPVSGDTGKPDQGYPGSYAGDIAASRHLLLVDLACPGETTASMTKVPAKAACLTAYKTAFHATSQLAAAEDFIAEYPGKIKLVTFDLGANNVDGCVSSSGVSTSCIANGQAAIVKQLPPVLATLRAALTLHDPGAAFVGMNYYDPFLGVAYAPGGLLASAAATLSIGETATLNAGLGLIYKRAAMPVANVSGAFRTPDATPLVAYGGKKLPLDVYEICRLTWMCPLKGSKYGANIHANTAGYAVIAASFESVIPATVP